MIEKQFEFLQKIIDRCVKHDYDRLKKAFSMKMDYISGEQLPEYIRKEIFKITEELVAMRQNFPALQSFAFDWNVPNFLWETMFIETLAPNVRKKYNAFSFESFEEKLYFENPALYDESLPYFSTIVKMVAYSKYLELLQNEEQKQMHPPTPIDEAMEPNDEIPPAKILGKDNPFKCKLDSDAFRLLADCVNDAHIFTTDITPQILEDFFFCRLEGTLRSANNRLLAYFMMKLNMSDYITYEWQSVMANNKLILAPKKEKYLNNSDLSSANENIKGILPKKSEIIDKYIKQLKKH